MRHGKILMTGITALALCMGIASTSRAGSYAYAEQTLTGLSVSLTGGTLTGATVSYGSSDASSLTALDGSSISSANSALPPGTDPAQAYVGTPAPPPQNTFSQFATFSSAPPQPSGDVPLTPSAGFSRGDALITPGSGLFSTSGVTTSNVAETFMTGATHAAGSGTGSWAITANFTVSGAATTGATLSYSTGYSNYLFASIFSSTDGLPGISAHANYALDFTLKNSAGLLIGEVTPGALNHSDGTPPNTVGLLLSGTDSGQIHAGLGDGSYSLTITGTEIVQAATAVPEPSSLILMCLGGGVGLVVLTARRRCKS